MDKNDAAFYVNDNNYEIVFECGRFAVIRNGDMRINIRLNKSDEWSALRYTQDLEKWGITTDEQLNSWAEQSDLFEWWDSPWFEVVDKNDLNADSDVIHELFVAVDECKRMNSEGVVNV